MTIPAGIGRSLGGAVGTMIGTLISPGSISTGKVIGEVAGELLERVVGWFTMDPKKIKDDALFKVLRQPLKTRTLFEIEKARRGK